MDYYTAKRLLNKVYMVILEKNDFFVYTPHVFKGLQSTQTSLVDSHMGILQYLNQAEDIIQISSGGKMRHKYDLY